MLRSYKSLTIPPRNHFVTAAVDRQQQFVAMAGCKNQVLRVVPRALYTYDADLIEQRRRPISNRRRQYRG